MKGSTKWKNMIFRQNKKNVHIFLLFKSFHAPALNACFFLLENQWVFEFSVIVAYESLSCPQCEKMDLKIIQSLLERVQIHKNAGKPKNLWELKDFSEEQQQFNCSGQTRDSWTTITKQKTQLWIIQVTSHSIKGIVHFEIKIWYLSAYPKGIQDVGVFFSSVDPILMFLGQTVLVCQSYNGRYRSLSL